MKLKLVADSKKWTIFIIFCIVLLYFVAIAVLNLYYFSHYGIAYGFNPIEAFTPQFILPTLVGFIVILAAVFISVSSYFFERDTGIGISTAPKKEKGYSRWEPEKEFKKQLSPVYPGQETVEKAGIPLINNGKTIWVDSGEYHNLIIGSTGSGKTEMTIQPMVKVLAKHGESMIITDPKGEIYEKNAIELREKGYNIVLLNFRNPQNGNCWNPLTLPYTLFKTGNQDKSIELLEDLAANILYDENNKSSDPFWEKTSADYFAGLALALFKDAKEEEINLNSINLMSTAGEDKCGNTTYIKEYFSDKDQGSSEYINVASTIMAPNETKSSILSVFKQKIKLFSSRENLSEMLSKSDFDMNDIGRKKTAVFIVIQDEKKTYHSLVTIFLKQCYETLISVAQESGGHLPFRTNFILDEFANMPPLKDVTTMVTAARSRHIRFTFVIQNFAQLYEVYGKENGETIKGNCGNIIYLISSELSALEEISKLCGEVKSKEKDKTASTPLVTVSDLQRLPQWTLIVIRIRMMPFKTKLTPNWQMVKNNGWGKNYDLASYPYREKGVVQTFDIKSFVDKKKEEKVAKMLNNITGGGAPTKGPDMGFNPFAPSKPSKPGGVPGFDVDEMVRRIDAKIAELEEEERREKEKMALEAKNKANDIPSVPPLDIPSASPLDLPSVPSLVPEPVEPEKPVNNVPVIETNKISVTPVVDEPKESLVPPDFDDDDDDDSTGGFFGLNKVEEPKPIENKLFDTIVPVKEEPKPVVPEVKEEKVELPKTEIQQPSPFTQDIKPVSSKEDVNSSLIINDDKDDDLLNPIEETIDIPVKEETKVETQPNNNSKGTKEIGTNYVTDDQFFDDFFSDDE